MNRPQQQTQPLNADIRIFRCPHCGGMNKTQVFHPGNEVRCSSCAGLFLTPSKALQNNAIPNRDPYLYWKCGALVLVILIAVLVSTRIWSSDWRIYNRAATEYREGHFSDSLLLLAWTSESCRNSPRAKYLKSDCLLNLASNSLNRLEYSRALEYLGGISPEFPKKGEINSLITAAQIGIKQIDDERTARISIARGQTSQTQRRPAQLRTYGGVIPYDREIQNSKVYQDMSDEIQGISSSQKPALRLHEVMTELELDAYTLNQAAQLEQDYTVDELNRMSDRELMQAMKNNRDKHSGK